MTPLDLTAAAAELGVTRDWLREEARRKRVPHIRAGRNYRFTPEQVASIRESWTVQPVAENPLAPTDRSQARRRSA